MGSGYGTNAFVTCHITTSESSNAVTGVQNAIFYFPEFTVFEILIASVLLTCSIPTGVHASIT